ncbi:ferritin-like domain-containing protein [Pedobacter arcticus]|uniref:ferritin-like domain-containing protein n=1 Tax=Pedobacter arcticus TaxID=752140 RepID=UPI0002EF07A9|nr:PA2169 family four-helix-bundle protein [Pedobacter arcticus]
MKNQNEIVSDLKGLINILNDGKVGYKEAVGNVKSENLKSTFLELSNQRYAYEEELKAHILQHGGSSDNDEGGVLGALHRAWLDIKDAFTADNDAAILEAITTGEKAALAKYDEVLEDYRDHADHYAMLSKQREGIASALAKIESLKIQHQS